MFQQKTADQTGKERQIAKRAKAFIAPDEPVRKMAKKETESKSG